MDGFWLPSWGQKMGVFWSCLQVASKRRPEGVQERLRTPQERPKSAQERPKSAPRASQEHPRTARRAPRGSQEGPQRGTKRAQEQLKSKIVIFQKSCSRVDGSMVFRGRSVREVPKIDRKSTKRVSERPWETTIVEKMCQERPNSAQKRPKSAPRAPKSAQEPPKSAQQRSKGGPRAS